MGHLEAVKVIGKIEWVVGDNPTTEAIKNVTIEEAGHRYQDRASFIGGVWRYAESGVEVGSVVECKVIAWANEAVVPTFDFKEPRGFTFGDAVEALKAGKKVYRSGWNGKGMYLWMLPEARVPADWCKEAHLKSLAENNPDGSKEMHCLPSIRMKTADGKVLTGWLASQSDIFAEDWVIAD